MIQIAFCDDDQTVLDQLSALLEKYRTQRCIQIQCTAFRSPLNLLAEIEKGTRYDILFLDVIMPAENGITVAKEIRQYDTAVEIIFLTSSTEFAVESYMVGAYFYQLKPIWEESFFRLTDSVIAECRRADQRSLVLRCKTGISRIELDRLLYCEVLGRTLLFHLCTKFKVPAFLGSSFAYLGGFSTVASMPAYDGLDPELKLAYALGGIVIAGLLYLVLALSLIHI